MKLSSSTNGQDIRGQIISLLSNDVSRFDEIFVNLHTIWVMPLQGVIITYLLWNNLGVAAFVGLFMLTLQSIPMQST